MYQTDTWRIEVPKKGLYAYRQNDVFFLRGSGVRRSPELEKHIEETWKIELERNPNIKPGPLLRLNKILETGRDNLLDLLISLTDYQEYKATCVPEHKRRFESKEGRTLRDEEKAHTFASAVMPVTLDGKVVFLERSSNVDYFKGMLNVPSGGVWDGDPKETITKLLDGALFKVCRGIVEREFRKKESNIQLKNDESPKLYGIAETLEHGENPFDDHALQFEIALDEDTDTLQRKKDKIAVGKYKDLVLVDLKEAAFADFLNENLERIPEAIQPIAIVTGAHKFGADWPFSIKGVRRI